jgi:nucleotide-binding universal stress UspA family protein
MLIQKILFPVDFSDRCRGAVSFVEEFVGRFQAELTLLHVVEPFTYLDLPSKEEERKKLLDTFLPADFEYFNVKRVLLHGDPALKTVDYARSNQTDLIMMPTHGFGPYRRFLLGSVTAKILHDVDTPVWTGAHMEQAPPIEKISVKNIVCAVDLGSQALKTLQWAAQLAGEFQARLTVVHVIPEPGAEVTVRNTLERLLHKPGTQAELRLEQGDIPDKVQQTAERLHADLLVIGRSSTEGVFGRLHTNAYAIIRQAPCAVISV